MKALLLTFALFGASAMANDTSYPSIKFETGKVETVQGYKNSTIARLEGGDAEKLFKILGTPNSAGAPQGYNESRGGLVLLGQNAKSGKAMYVSLSCYKAEYDFDQQKMIYFKSPKCSVAIVDEDYQSDLSDFEPKMCGK